MASISRWAAKDGSSSCRRGGSPIWVRTSGDRSVSACARNTFGWEHPRTTTQIPLDGTVMVTGSFGDEQLLAVRLGDGDIRIAGVDPDLSLSTGSQIEAAVATDHLHFFDELEQMQ